MSRGRIAALAAALALMLLGIAGFTDPTMQVGPVTAVALDVGPSRSAPPVAEAVIDTHTIVLAFDWMDTSGGVAHGSWPAEFDTIYFDPGDGSIMTCGRIRKENPDSVLYDATQLLGRSMVSTTLPDALANYIFIRPNLDLIPDGSTILSARLGMNITTGWSLDLSSAGRWMEARLDTSSVDDAALMAGVVGRRARTAGQLSYRNPTWNSADSSGAVAWWRDMDDRDDCHDFGISSETLSGTAYSGGDTLSLDLTTAVQMHRGFDLPGSIIWLFAFGWGGTFPIQCGPNATYDSAQPFLVVTYTTEKYAGPWGGYATAFSFQAPDADDDALEWAEVFDEFGYKFSPMAPASLLGASENYLSVAEWQGLLADGHDCGSHSVTHLGVQNWTDTATGRDSLALDVDRGWVADSLGIAASATSRSFVHAVDDFNFNSIVALYEAGYYGAVLSDVGLSPAAAKTGGSDPVLSRRLFWNEAGNPYLAGAVPIRHITGEPPVTADDTTMTKAEIIENVEDHIASVALRGGGAFMHTGAHCTKETSVLTSRYATMAELDTDELRWMLEYLTSLRVFGIMTLDRAFMLYHRAHPYLEADSLSAGGAVSGGDVKYVPAVGQCGQDSLQIRSKWVCSDGDSATTGWLADWRTATATLDSVDTGKAAAVDDTFQVYIQVRDPRARVTPWAPAGWFTINGGGDSVEHGDGHSFYDPEG